MAFPSEGLVPKSVIALRDYDLGKFTKDLIAGITVGLVALPLAMAFAISSGVKPESGIYCAIVAGFIISALGGSRCQIGGPTGAFVVVVAGIHAAHGMDGLFMTTMMAGVLLMILGLTGLGTAVKYIPRPVVLGFTNGIAVLIASTQIKDFFGLEIAKVPGEFLDRMAAIAGHWHTVSTPATLLGIGALATLLVMAKITKRVPGAIVVLFLGTGIAWALGMPVETIETRFGGIPSGLPALHVPTFRPELILPLLSPVLTVTMLGAIESLLSAVVADRMSGDKHNPNIELVAQGVANVMSPLFGGLPATGAIARTATNIRAGAQTPIAGMIHAVTLLAVILFAAPLAKHIPLPLLSAILFVVAYNMGEWKEVPEVIGMGRAPFMVWLITFTLTVFADLTVAVEAGMILAALLYIGRVTATTTVSRVTPEDVQAGFAHSLQMNELPEGVVVYRIHGPFLFGSTDKLDIVSDELESLPRVVVLRLRNMNAIDTTGMKSLQNLADTLHASDRELILCGMREQPSQILQKAEFHQHIGERNITANLEQAIARARDILAG